MTTEDPASVFLESERVPGSGDVSSSPTFRHGSSEILLQSSKNPLEDPTNPYYLYHGDNPSNALVSQPLTGQDNYVSWSRAMQLSISVKNKLGFLDGSIPQPSITDHVLHNAWIRNNNIVIS